MALCSVLVGVLEWVSCGCSTGHTCMQEAYLLIVLKGHCGVLLSPGAI